MTPRLPRCLGPGFALVALLAVGAGAGPAAGPAGAAAKAPPRAKPAAKSADPGLTPAPTPGAQSSIVAAHENAMRHYVQGLWLETAGDVTGAIGEVGRAFAFEPGAPEIALKLADLSLQNGNANAGLDYAHRAVALGERSGHAHFLAGSALVALSQPSLAKPEFERCVAEDSTNSDAWQALGNLDDGLGLVDAARDAYARAYAIDSEDSDVAFRLGGLEARRGRWGEAATLFARVESMNPFQPGLYVSRGFVAERLGRTDEAVKDYELHLHAYPTDDRTRKRLVQALLQSEDYTSAAREAQELVAASPDDFEASRLLASLDLTLKKDDAAIGVVTDLRRRLPGEIEPAAFAVAVLLRVGKEGAARDEADKLTHEAPHDSRAWLVAAEAWASGETPGHPASEADARYAKARAALADSTGAYVELAQSLTRTGRYDAAEDVFKQAVAKEPGNARLWLEVAYARERKQDLAGAETAARHVLDIDPKSTQALNFLGYLFADHNVKLDQAVPLIQKALDLDPDNPYYIDSLGWAYYRMGKLEEARGELERAIRLGAEESEVLEHLGDVDLALHSTVDAKSNYTKALQLDPTRAQLVKKLEALR